MSDVLDEGPFFHGTKADLRVGDLLRAGYRSNYRPELVMNHIYFTALPDGAGLAAELAADERAPRVYVVEPTGAFEDDPNGGDPRGRVRRDHQLIPDRAEDLALPVPRPAVAGHRYREPVTDSLPPCPECSSEYTYELGVLLVCPECAHEWQAAPADEATEGDAIESVIKDAVGNVLADGDTVVVTRSLKVKGNPTAIKVGTKVRNIRLVDGVDDHDIDCKVDGFGSMQLKSSVVKKV